MVSSIGYLILSGKMQLDRQDTTLVTPISWAVCSTLSLILRLSLCGGSVLVRTVDHRREERQRIVAPKNAGFPSCGDKVLQLLRPSGSHGWGGTSRTLPWFARGLCFNIRIGGTWIWMSRILLRSLKLLT